MKQSNLRLNLTTKRTRKRELLDGMVLQGPLGRPPFAVEAMLRIHFMLQSLRWQATTALLSCPSAQATKMSPRSASPARSCVARSAPEAVHALQCSTPVSLGGE